MNSDQKFCFKLNILLLYDQEGLSKYTNLKKMNNGFYINYINWVKTSWTYGSSLVVELNGYFLDIIKELGGTEEDLKLCEEVFKSVVRIRIRWFLTSFTFFLLDPGLFSPEPICNNRYIELFSSWTIFLNQILKLLSFIQSTIYSFLLSLTRSCCHSLARCLDWRESRGGGSRR